MKPEDNINVKDLWKEYAPPVDSAFTFTDENIKTVTLKRIIANELTSYDRTILLLYAEIGSLREVANYLDVSHSAVIKKVDNIKAQIMERYHELMRDKIDNDIDRKLR